MSVDPHNEYKTQCTGLGAILGAIRTADIKPDTNQDGLSRSGSADKGHERSRSQEANHETEEQRRRRLADVCDVSFGPKTSKVLQIDYSCHICDVTCNSELGYTQHIKGKQHAKKARAQENKREALNQGGPMAKKHKSGQNDFVALVNDTDEGIVGLEHVDRIVPSSTNLSYDVAYCCTLCDITSLGGNMFMHIMGIKHRNAYFKFRFGWTPMETKEAQARAKEIQEREGKDLTKMKTIVSDARYPWPAGHGPQAQSAKPAPELPPDHDCALDFLEKLEEQELDNETEAAYLFESVSTMLTKLIDYRMKTVGPRHADSLLGCRDSLIKSLQTVMNMPIDTKKKQDDISQVSSGVTSNPRGNFPAPLRDSGMPRNPSVDFPEHPRESSGMPPNPRADFSEHPRDSRSPPNPKANFHNHSGMSSRARDSGMPSEPSVSIPAHLREIGMPLHARSNLHGNPDHSKAAETPINPLFKSNTRPQNPQNPPMSSNPRPQISTNVRPPMASNVRPLMSSNVRPPMSTNTRPPLSMNVRPLMSRNVRPPMPMNTRPPMSMNTRSPMSRPPMSRPPISSNPLMSMNVRPQMNTRSQSSGLLPTPPNNARQDGYFTNNFAGRGSNVGSRWS